MVFMNKIDKILYPGSFDPITLGHEDLIKQAARLASTVIVAVAEDNQKTSLFTSKQRVLMLFSQEIKCSIYDEGLKKRN